MMMIYDLTPFLASLADSVRSIIHLIDSNELQTALVVDEQRCLLGVITDGDIRRGLLSGLSLDEAVDRIVNRNPTTVPSGTDQRAITALMHRNKLWRIPVIDSQGRVEALAVPDEHSRPNYPNLVVVMAGGLGSRLGELTRDVPKPLLTVGPQPILETILGGFASQGFYNFAFSVNYKAEMIEKHFGDGSTWGVNIGYLREDKRLGTAGALSLLNPVPDETLLVMNGDLLTRVDFRRLLDFHQSGSSAATMAVRNYDLTIPFGVVELVDREVLQIVEKPVQHHFINAGIYALEPSCLDLVPHGHFFDMPELMTALLHDGRRVSSFPVHEYWQDVGRPDDLLDARRNYPEVFARPTKHSGI